MIYDVAIVGAGAAGLAAARDLSASGKRICIIDARDRIGGRIDTRRVDGLTIPIELGAEFIHGEAKETLAVADAAQLVAYELPDTHHWSRRGRWKEQNDFWDELEEIVKPLSRLKRDISFDRYLRTRRTMTPRRCELAWNFVEGYHAAHADRISAMALANGGAGGGKQLRLLDGYAAVMRWLLAGCAPERTDVRLAHVVTRIRWKTNDVTIDAGGETIHARAAVITIPIGVWKNGSIRFDPPLDEKERAIAKLESGHVVKIIFRFREAFWDDFNFLHCNDCAIPTWWNAAPLRAPILTAWAGGHAADRLLIESPETRVERALEALAQAFNVKRGIIDERLIATHTHDWQSDPFALCSYSYASVGGSNAHARLSRPIDSTLYFAGEATSGDETGTVNGAIASGRRAAREIAAR